MLVAIVGDLFGLMLLIARPKRRRFGGRRGRSRAADRGRRRTHIVERQIQRESAAVALTALQANFAAEQIRQFAADRQAQARAAVLAACAGVRLLERLEDDLLLVGRDADAGVAHLEGDDGAARASRIGMIAGPAVPRRAARAGAPRHVR